MGDPDYCEKKCPVCTRARAGNRLARFVQTIELLVTFGGCPHGVRGSTSMEFGPMSRCHRK